MKYKVNFQTTGECLLNICIINLIHAQISLELMNKIWKVVFYYDFEGGILLGSFTT